MLRLSILARASVVLLSCASVAVADIRDVRLSAQTELPPWAVDNTLKMKLTTDSTNYALIPLTEGLGLGGSPASRQIIQINGTLRSAKSSNYESITGPDDVAYMSCDKPDDPAKPMPLAMLDVLMSAAPKAIVLYTTSKNWCFLDNTRDLPYPSILSMVDPGEANAVLTHLNETSTTPKIVNVSIAGNTTDMTKPVPPDHASGRKSQVAMSILYSITGLITLLFLLIIVTGAVRAHRYPERYGPRRGDGQRPSQSRAKGLARAVLETIPIVKFGDNHASKPDPDLEMETATTYGREGQIKRAMSHSSELKSGQAVDGTESVRRPSDAWTDCDDVSDLGLRCSICTEDFRVGEDVRVLPCNHQFHPNCIDPWLINVSGTCPLCRLDLRPGHVESQQDGRAAPGDAALPPPLEWEWSEHDNSQNSYRNRVSRLFDVNRLRQASAEEQMEALRQLREDRMARESAATERGESQHVEEEQQHQGVPFADKLKEKFRILTKSQSALRRTT